MKGEQHQPTPRSRPALEPKIYVASLSDYNNGHLHGDWIEAAQDPGDIGNEIDSMLERSPKTAPKSGPSTTTKASAPSSSASTKTSVPSP